MSATLETSTGAQLAEGLKDVNHITGDAVDRARMHLNQLDLPTKKDEDWKYTPIRLLPTQIKHLPHEAWHVVQQKQGRINVDHWIPEGHDGPVLVFDNGAYRDDLSTGHQSDNHFAGSLREAKETMPELFRKHFGHLAQTDKHVFTAMNTAHATGGAFLWVKDNAIAEQPIHLVHINSGDGTLAQPHHVIVAGKNSQMKVSATFATDGNAHTLNNVVIEASVDADAIVYLDKIQAEDEASTTICTEYVAQERNSTFSISTITLNGGLVRNGLNISVDGEHCETNLSGLYVTKGNQHVDSHTVVDHRVPNCNSNELYKGLLDEKSTGVFNGKVFVRQDAQKTNAFQSNGNILLSDDATINSKPELEIYADDVKCSHGSTTGQLDEEAIFYLRARGLSHDSARKLMVHAFAADVLETIHHPGMLAQVNRLLEERFNWTF